MEPETKKRGFGETNTPILCANNCGFFGNATTNNLCSKCYKDLILMQSKACSIDATAKEESNVGGDDVDKFVVENSCEVEEGAEGTTASENPAKRLANRCSYCRKKVGLTGFKCRCDQMFCSLHRYSDKHNCVFDYKSVGQDAIAKSNPVVKADKVDKI